MSKCSDAIRIVQFMHPGGEMKPHDAKKEDIPWNKILKQKCGARGCSGSCGGHKRKFIKTYGDYVDNKYNLQHDQEIMFWGEYEPKSVCEKFSPKDESYPQNIHTLCPANFDDSDNDECLLNTDPYIFGDHMVYSNCHQRGNSCLKHLKEESVIVMGSKIGGVFCFDTVFVVGKRLGVYSFATQDVEKKLMVLKKEEKLSDNFWEATIKPLLKEHIGSENREFVLYKAATYDQKTGNGMYSFFPCKIFDKNGGFPRPKATSQWISHGMSMNYKRHVMDGKQAKDFWESLRKDVLDSGLYLGVKVEEPNQKCVLKG